MTEQQLQRFRGRVKVGKSDECWEWTGKLWRTGYGLFSVDGVPKIASRLAWEIANGPIPDGKFVLHSCDNRACCNPSHLRIGTQQDNVQDMLDRKRHRVLSGDEHPWRKRPELVRRGEAQTQVGLTDERVMEIRRKHWDGVAMSQLARDYGLSNGGIRKIVRGETWTHLPVLGSPEMVRSDKQVRLTGPLVRRIHERLVTGVSRKDVAAEFGLTYATIATVAKGDTWKHLGLAFPTGKAKGSGAASAVLTEESVTEMRALYDSGKATIADLAKRFGVSWQTAEKAIHRKTWRHI